MSRILNWNSKRLTQGWQKGVHAFYYGLGWKEGDLNKAQIGIGTPLLEGNLCNLHAYELAQEIIKGCNEAGLKGFAFGGNGKRYIRICINCFRLKLSGDLRL